MAQPSTVRLSDADDLVVACRPLQPDEKIVVGDRHAVVRDPIPAGHKVSIAPFAAGDAIRKYGQTIGFASRPIPAGSHVHSHNVTAGSFERDYAYATEVPPPPPAAPPRTFRGYERADGRVGTRNYVAIISTVNCSASVSRAIRAGISDAELAERAHVDGIVALTHKAGCAAQLGGDDHRQLERVLAGYARHPNVGAYVLVGLGCETLQAAELLANQGLVQVENLSAGAGSPELSADAPPVISIQQEGGTARAIEAGIRAVRQLLPRVDAARRTEQPASKLLLGTECGGSDGNSGITANPAVGVAADLIVAQGGTAVLGETSEIYGAEHLLTRRAVTREVGEALVERIRWWEWYTGVFGAEIDNNPSPGNKAGGLTTIYEKSLGAIAKGGSTALTAVVPYAAPVTTPGLAVMDTPGYDPTSLTGLVAGGANVCVFTTGRGSVYGCKPVPSIKIATNSELFERMNDDMDIDAGVVLDGVPVREVGERIFDAILAVASGDATKSERLGVGEEEFSPWSIGPVL